MFVGRIHENEQVSRPRIAPERIHDKIREAIISKAHIRRVIAHKDALAGREGDHTGSAARIVSRLAVTCTRHPEGDSTVAV